MTRLCRADRWWGDSGRSVKKVNADPRLLSFNRIYTLFDSVFLVPYQGLLRQYSPITAMHHQINRYFIFSPACYVQHKSSALVAETGNLLVRPPTQIIPQYAGENHSNPSLALHYIFKSWRVSSGKKKYTEGTERMGYVRTIQWKQSGRALGKLHTYNTSGWSRSRPPKPNLPSWDVDQDLSSTDPIKRVLRTPWRFHGSHPSTWWAIKLDLMQVRNASALKDLLDPEL